MALTLGLWHTINCPTSFSQTNTTVGAISNSKQLTLCVTNSYVVKGSNGSLTLVLNSNQSAPKCLNYPNGLNSDLSFSLLDSGHVGCWSLYPPSEPLTIVNLGAPSQAKISQALKSFRPLQPRILLKPGNQVPIGTTVGFSNTAKLELQKGILLNLPVEVSFRPISYRWMFAGRAYQNASFLTKVITKGNFPVTLTVSYSVEYRFPGLLNWRIVKPDILLNASPVNLLATEAASSNRRPRLVDQPCFTAARWGC